MSRLERRLAESERPSAAEGDGVWIRTFATMSVETIYWHTLHPKFLNKDSRVIDLGANHGRFSKAIVERFGCRCHAIEASPRVYENMICDERIEKFNLAIAPF